VAARLLVRLLEELLLPTTYHADLAGSSYNLVTEQQGLQLGCWGFSEVLLQLLEMVLERMAGRPGGRLRVVHLDHLQVHPRGPSHTGTQDHTL
jgi:secreted Zn-dependent insulinase-like peptidase